MNQASPEPSTTRILSILRHAKSSWDDPSLSDYDRPLNQRGIKAATIMGRHLNANSLAPDLVLCSSAVRASQTWELVQKELDRKPELISVKQLYLANVPTLVNVVRRYADAQANVMVVAHNPGLHEFVEMVGGPIEKFPTGALARFEYELESWSNLQVELRCKSWSLIKPKELG